MLARLRNRAVCSWMLHRVSRSFNMVIQGLPGALRNDVRIFYLVLRGLDTIEDDMALGGGAKRDLLRRFPDYACSNGGAHPDFVVGEGHERDLMLRFGAVRAECAALPLVPRETIYGTAWDMSAGMRRHLDREEAGGRRTMGDYNDYCHVAAGLVGDGLTHMFVDSGVERSRLLDHMPAAHAMGAFLQKTNIIRDIYEDAPAGRHYWPDCCAAVDGDSDEELRHKLDTMIEDALRTHAETAGYLDQLRDRSVFRFCAVPQLMALSTLARIRGDTAVFSSRLRVDRGCVLRLWRDVGDFRSYRAEAQKLACA